MEIVCLNKRWNHHTSSGGYDRLAQALNAIDVRSRPVEGVIARVVQKAWSSFYGHKPHLLLYSFADRLAEERAFWTAWRHGAQIVHAAYGDEQLDTLLRRKRLLPGRLVATFHLPAERTRDRFERLQREEMKRLDGAVVVASKEVAEFARWLGQDKVMYVPHGIDTEVFTPGSHAIGPRLRLVFVGFHMRDFEVAHRVVDRCAREDIPVEFDVVLPKAWQDRFTGCDNIRMHSNIPEQELIRLYQLADALFLPVTGATANNAVLEALACGAPVISTGIGGIGDYVDPSCGWLLPVGDAEAAFHCVRSLALAPRQAADKRNAARTKAETFAWHHVAEQIKQGYQRLLDNRHFAP